MNTKCDELMDTLETERESVRLLKLQDDEDIAAAQQRYEQAAQQSAQLQSQYEVLESQRKSDQEIAERKQASVEAMLSQAAKLRAQLSGGRARGKLLIEQYETKLDKKTNNDRKPKSKNCGSSSHIRRFQ